MLETLRTSIAALNTVLNGDTTFISDTDLWRLEGIRDRLINKLAKLIARQETTQ